MRARNNRTLRLLALLLGASFLGAVAGCGDDDNPMPPAQADCTSVADTTLAATVSYKDDVEPIFSVGGCLNSGCHGAPFNSSGFAVNTYDDVLTSGDEARAMGLCGIKPGSPEDSYLIWKIEGRPGISGERMPRAPAAMLSQEQIQTFRTWILEGARNN